MERLLKEIDLAESFGIDEKTAERWRMAGEGPPWIKVGRGVRYRPRDVERWLDENTRTPNPQH